MTRDMIKAAALRELAKHGKTFRDGQDERGGYLAAALGRVSLAYDLWVDRGREASAELLIDAALDAVDAIHATAAGKAGAP
jgi:hypothetical protein